MTDTETKGRSAGKPLTRALAGWESEGGSPQAASSGNCVEQPSLTEDEEHILQCLGAAVIVQWNDLPTRMQRQLFDHAASMGEPRQTTQLKEQIARFLHNHKDDTRETA